MNTMAVSVVSSEVVTTADLAKDINHACSATEADVLSVLQAVGQRIGDALLDGNRVEIDHIGTFSLALTCKNKRKEDHITSKDIEVSRIVYSPCTELQQAMRGAVIVSEYVQTSVTLPLRRAMSPLAAPAASPRIDLPPPCWEPKTMMQYFGANVVVAPDAGFVSPGGVASFHTQSRRSSYCDEVSATRLPLESYFAPATLALW